VHDVIDFETMGGNNEYTMKEKEICKGCLNNGFEHIRGISHNKTQKEERNKK